MEATRITDERSKRVAKQTSHGLLVRMGGKEWVVGDAESTVLPFPTGSPEDETTSLSMTHSELIRPSNVDARGIRYHLKSRWTEFHQFLSFMLDRLIQQNEDSGDEQPLALRRTQESPSASSPHFSRRFIPRTLKGRFRDGFTYGTIIGLMLGCAGLIVFHQVAVQDVISPEVVSTVSNAVPAAPTPVTGSGFMLPSVRVYATQVGSYRSVSEAKDAQSQLLHRGVKTTLLSNKPIRLFTKVALQSDHLMSEQRRLEQMHIPVVVTTLQWSVQSVPVSQSIPIPHIDDVSHWLSADVSALNTMTGVICDGEPARDADMAFQSAERLVPMPAVLTDTGHSSALSAIEKATEIAFKQMKAGDGAQALNNIGSSYALLQGLADGADSSGN